MPCVRLSAVIVVLAPVLSVACGGTSSPSAAPAATAASQPAPAPAAVPAGDPRGSAAGAPADTVSGTVAETMNSGGYTYARLSGNGGDTWIAAPAMLTVTVGDPLVATISMPMEKFRSRTLNREFDLIYFVSSVSRNGETLTDDPNPPGGLSMAGSHGGSMPSSSPAPPVEPVAAAPGGLTVADVWAKRDALAGKTVTVRARVVKANYEIMGVNWYHLQDGSGTEKDSTNDLTITSDAQAKVGDVVTISGTLVTKKDFGAGYAYDVIVEQASIRK
jgi:hypothetical protein